MSETKKQRAVLLSDAEYEMCLRISGKRLFSAWARKVLLDASGGQQRRGEVAGGLCAKPDCDQAGWVKVPNMGWYCKADADHFVKAGVPVEEHTPVAEQYVRSVDAALLGLFSVGEWENLQKALRSILTSLMHAGKREVLVQVALWAAAFAESIDSAPTSYLKPGLLTELEEEPK